MLRSVLLLSIALPLAACAAPATSSVGTSEASHLDISASPITNFGQVNDGIFRGAHPDAMDLDYLQSIGVKTIVDLEIGDLIEAWPWEITEEENAANARGFVFIRKPMSAFEPALSARFDEQMDSIMDILKDPAQRPVYVHCKHGQDRTGLVIGLERVIDEGWDPGRAHDEMLSYGFHTAFIGLEDYFERKTGWTPSGN